MKAVALVRNRPSATAFFDSLKIFITFKMLLDFVHKASRRIINYCLENEIGTIVVGKLSRSIIKIDIGSTNNQKLHQMPYGKFLSKLKYKCEKSKYKSYQSR